MKMLCCIAWLAFVWLLYCLADCLHGPTKLILQIVATLMLSSRLDSIHDFNSKIQCLLAYVYVSATESQQDGPEAVFGRLDYRKTVENINFAKERCTDGKEAEDEKRLRPYHDKSITLLKQFGGWKQRLIFCLLACLNGSGITTAEFAEAVERSEYSVREWCRLGRIHATKKNSGRGSHPAWVIHADELDPLSQGWSAQPKTPSIMLCVSERREVGISFSDVCCMSHPTIKYPLIDALQHASTNKRVPKNVPPRELPSTYHYRVPAADDRGLRL